MSEDLATVSTAASLVRTRWMIRLTANFTNLRGSFAHQTILEQLRSIKHTQMHAFCSLPLHGANFATMCATRVGHRGQNLLKFQTPLPAFARIASTTQDLQVCLVVRSALTSRYNVVDSQRIFDCVERSAKSALTYTTDQATRDRRPITSHALSRRYAAVSTAALLLGKYNSLTAGTRFWQHVR